MAEQGIAQCIVLEDDTIVDWAFMAQLAATDLAARDIPYLRLYSKFPTFSRIVERDFLQHSRSVVELVGYPFGTQRSEERRVGKECVSTCRYRWQPYHKKKKK